MPLRQPGLPGDHGLGLLDGGLGQGTTGPAGFFLAGELYAADPEAIQGETLVVAALQGDPLARRAFDRVGRSLGQAIAAVVHLLGLTRVVIGGRFARAWEVFQSPLQEELHRRLTLFPPEAVSVCPAQLGDDAGLVGAARLAWPLEAK